MDMKSLLIRYLRCVSRLIPGFTPGCFLFKHKCEGFVEGFCRQLELAEANRCSVHQSWTEAFTADIGLNSRFNST